MSATPEGVVAVQRQAAPAPTTLETIVAMLEMVLCEQRKLRSVVAPTVRAVPTGPMSPEEFGRAIGRSGKTVRRWIESGKLKAMKTGRVTLIRPVDAQKFLAGAPEREAWL